MDSKPVTPLVHVFVADLEGASAVRATGTDGEQYCILDTAVLDDANTSARASAREVFLTACKLAARPAHIAAG